MRAAAFCLLALGLAACLSPRSVPATPEVECPLVLLEGELLADDADGFLVRHESGAVTAVVWPDGYTVRDADVRELLDPDGRVTAREGEFVSLGGGMTPNDTAFVVCGPFTVTPAGASSPPNPGIPQPSEEACDAALLEGRLVADDAARFLVAHESGAVTPVVWPEGYLVAVADHGLALLDPVGTVVAVEDDFVELGGGMTADDTAFVVCGPFTVTPAR